MRLEEGDGVSGLYHEASRRLQDRFDTRRIADRLEEVNLHAVFDESDRSLIGESAMFFLATADAEGFPDVSYKGGDPGFVRVTGESTLMFPNYDGNGMYLSMGNIDVNPKVTLLFVKWGERPRRLRVQGQAKLTADPDLVGAYDGAQFVVQVSVERIFRNCPRYIHHFELVDYSAYVPHAGEKPPVPEWKKDPKYRDALPERDRDT